MIRYLSGAILPQLPALGIGYMLTPLMGNRPDLSKAFWAADNGCFSQPQRFDLGEFIHFFIDRPAETCLFVVAPDVVGDARATWKRSRHVLPVIRRLDYKAAYVFQDGIEREDIKWEEFDVAFIGGTTAWKTSQVAIRLIREAKDEGKWVHCGRVNSYKRLRLYADAGADSADGTFLAFGPDRNLPRLLRWLRNIERQPAMEVLS